MRPVVLAVNGIHRISREQGIGLVEVMVALFLLAVGILGFSAMQHMALRATDESRMRTRALSIIRGGAETMRVNPLGIEAFKDAINTTATATMSSVNGIDITSCQGVNAVCTVEQLAIRDAIAITTYAKQNNLNIAMVTCPVANVSNAEADTTASVTKIVQAQQQCFVMSWGATTAKLDDDDPTACANSDGTYHTGKQCFIIESY